MRNKMKKRNGFTLVELLAVIVVLAIIMVIAIPSVLEAMNNAKKNSFVLYMEKVFKSTSEYYLQDSATEIISECFFKISAIFFSKFIFSLNLFNIID